LSIKQAKVNDRGIAAIAYNTILRPGFTLGLGLSLDTQKLNEASHKVRQKFSFN
jgi:voltage-dependent anion channel protein 2